MKRKPIPPLNQLDQSRYLTLSEAATYLRKTPKALMRLCERKRIPFIKQGRTTIFDRKALDAWLTGLVKVTAEEALQRHQGKSQHPAVIRMLQKHVGTDVGTLVGMNG